VIVEIENTMSKRHPKNRRDFILTFKLKVIKEKSISINKKKN